MFCSRIYWFNLANWPAAPRNFGSRGTNSTSCLIQQILPDKQLNAICLFYWMSNWILKLLINSAWQTPISKQCFLLEDLWSFRIAELTGQAIVFYSCTYYSTKLPVPEQRVPLDEIPFHYCVFHSTWYRSTTACSILRIQFYNSLFYVTSSSVSQAEYSSRRIPLVNSSVPFLQNCQLGDQFVFYSNKLTQERIRVPRCHVDSSSSVL